MCCTLLYPANSVKNEAFARSIIDDVIYLVENIGQTENMSVTDFIKNVK